MLFTMLFEDSKIEATEKPRIQNATVVRKSTPLVLLLFVLSFVALVTVGVLFLVYRLIPQYLVSSILFFAASIVPIFFLIEFLFFRLSIGSGKIALRKLGTAEAVYSYTDVSWKKPKDSRAVILYANGKPIARVPRSASNFGAVVKLRHKGTVSAEEKEMLRKIESSAKK